jgi:hypothetical protein
MDICRVADAAARLRDRAAQVTVSARAGHDAARKE